MTFPPDPEHQTRPYQGRDLDEVVYPARDLAHGRVLRELVGPAPELAQGRLLGEVLALSDTDDDAWF